MQHRLHPALLAAIAVSGAPLARAADPAAADPVRANELRLGAYYIQFSVRADDFSGPFTPPGLNADLKDSTTLYAAYVRRLDEHFSLEFAFGVPPKTRTVGRGPAFAGSVPFNGQEILTARWISPTLLLDYTLFDESARLRPYFGVGINRTVFVERRITPAGIAVVGGPTQVSLPASTGGAATVGLNLRITPRIHVYGSYSMSQVRTHLTTNTLGVLRTSNVDFGPRAWVLSAGWSF